MSFMFNPFPYKDPKAVNPIEVDKVYTDMIQDNSVDCANAIMKAAIEQEARVIGIDGFIGAPFTELAGMLRQSAANFGVELDILTTETLYKDSDTLEKELDEYLPVDLEKDPINLYGLLFDGRYQDLMSDGKIQSLQTEIAEIKSNSNKIIIVNGNGALIDEIAQLCDLKAFIDITPMQVVLNVKEGRVKNLGDDKARTYKELMRRCYYVDFELSMEMRGSLIKNNLDFYIQGDVPSNLQLIPMESLNAIFDSLVNYPLRCRPVYLEGIWGGHYISRLRNLPKEMKNCAWIFDMIPLEVSVVTTHNDKSVEFPFFTFVQAKGNEIMGSSAVEKFDGYFPMRFNYDDTWHAGGNMSIQVHPGHDYTVTNYNEKGRQDESYYVVETGHDAKTYLGFNDDADIDDFIDKVIESENTGCEVDYKKYISGVDSQPGTQVMIPAGTIHSSGRNQVVLEIGSLTIGSYTYKMYDYMRTDYDGKPRPIHSYHGSKVLARERTESWIKGNIVHEPIVIREGHGYKETIVGEHDLLYFSLRNLIFEEKIEDDTKGIFHVLALVDGEKIRVQSVDNPNRFFVQEYLDVVVVPHNIGKYEIINMGNGPVTVHKTMLKDGFIDD